MDASHETPARNIQTLCVDRDGIAIWGLPAQVHHQRPAQEPIFTKQVFHVNKITKPTIALESKPLHAAGRQNSSVQKWKPPPAQPSLEPPPASSKKKNVGNVS